MYLPMSHIYGCTTYCAQWEIFAAFSEAFSSFSLACLSSDRCLSSIDNLLDSALNFFTASTTTVCGGSQRVSQIMQAVTCLLQNRTKWRWQYRLDEGKFAAVAQETWPRTWDGQLWKGKVFLDPALADPSSTPRAFLNPVSHIVHPEASNWGVCGMSPTCSWSTYLSFMFPVFLPSYRA